ncbi:hypothetical protein CB0940_07283 [Lecanosticta acicola]|uniref:Uncharacterized protein n=1 Tax=Lecanosticta acicola TaxID=111012 RepID=A0AAI8Z2X0_9PEZI|nr:hypothetical protein CB0940_07283 [Lecanosticta acicola]
MAVISDDNPVKKEFLLPGDIVSLITSLLSLPLIAVFFYQRWQWQRWQRCHSNLATGTQWTVATITLLVSYVTAFLFVLILTVLLHIRPGENLGLCDATILLCLTLYVVSKSATLLFLIERAYIITWPVQPRWKDTEYVLNCTCIFVPYLIVTELIATCKSRVAMYVGHDVCVIGIKEYALIPLVVVEAGSYTYLTLRFLWPLIQVHFGGPGLLLPLRRVVLRTCIGTGITMLSLLTVKVSLLLFNGEPAWLCCMTCKIDAVIGCICLHSVTAPETQQIAEHGSPQELGRGLEKQTTLVERSGSGSRTIPESSNECSLKDVL